MSNSKASKRKTLPDVLRDMQVKERKIAGENRSTFAGISSQSSPLGGSGRQGTENNTTPQASYLRTEGDTMVGAIAFYPTAVTVSSGAIDITKETSGKYSTYVTVNGEGSTDDTIDTITGAAHAGQLLILQPNTVTQLTLTETGGNIQLPGGTDITINSAKDGASTVTLLFDPSIAGGGNEWILVANSEGVAGTGTVSDNGAKVTKSASQTISASTLTVITWNQEEWDTDGYHDNATNNSRLTIPAGKDGKYLVIFGSAWAGTAGAGEIFIEILVNGTDRHAFNRIPDAAESEQITSTILDLAVSDYVEARVFLDTGSGDDFTSTTSFFLLQKIDTGGSVSFPIQPPVIDHGATGTTESIDMSLTTGHTHLLEVDANVTLTFDNPPASLTEMTFKLILENTGTTTAYTVTLPSSVRQLSSINVPASTPAARGVYVFSTYDGGTNYDVIQVVDGTTGTGSGSGWSTFPALQNVDMASFDLTSLGNITYGSTGFDIGDATTPLNALFVEEVRFQSGTIVSNKPMITSVGGNSVDINHPTGSQVNISENGATAAVTLDGSGLITGDNILLDQIMTFNDNATDPVSNGQITRNGADLKTFSGGAVRNFSDIGSGTTLPVADTTSIVEGSADATKELRFEVDGFTTGTTRVITPPDSDINLPGTNITNTWSQVQTFGANIDFDAATYDIADSTNYALNAFLGRARFPANVTVTANAFNIVRNTVNSVDSMVLNVPSSRNVVVSENNVLGAVFNFVSGQLDLQQDGGLNVFKITGSTGAPWFVSKAGTTAALYTCSNGHQFSGGDVDFEDNSLTSISQVDMTTPAGAAVSSVIMNDLSTDVAEIRLGTSVDFALTDNGSNRMFFNNTLNTMNFEGLTEVQLPTQVRISDVGTAPSTPSAGTAVLYVFDAGGGDQSLRIKFDNGTIATIADD